MREIEDLLRQGDLIEADAFLCWGLVPKIALEAGEDGRSRVVALRVD